MLLPKQKAKITAISHPRCSNLEMTWGRAGERWRRNGEVIVGSTQNILTLIRSHARWWQVAWLSTATTTWPPRRTSSARIMTKSLTEIVSFWRRGKPLMRPVSQTYGKRRRWVTLNIVVLRLDSFLLLFHTMSGKKNLPRLLKTQLSIRQALQEILHPGIDLCSALGLRPQPHLPLSRPPHLFLQLLPLRSLRPLILLL